MVYQARTCFVGAILVTILNLTAHAAFAGSLQLGSPFTEHMVLQRGKPIPVWGTAAPSTPITVHLATQHAEATSDKDGKWNLTLNSLPAGGPYELTAAAGNESATVKDILIGDVWLCTGQSNMQMSLGECDDFANVTAVPHPLLRLGKVGQAWTATPQHTAKIAWTLADAATAKTFSAVAYYFAHELDKDPVMKNVPIGLLEDCLGGTVIESWIPKSGLAAFDPKDLQSSMFGIGPTILYNAMIAPLETTTFTGVIWYQGEGNSGQPERYEKLLPILFKSWREQFNDPRLPFLVVQLPDYATDFGGVYWQWIREAQAKAVANSTDASLAVTINTNDGWNLHPQGKHDIGHRLALLARHDVYKESVTGRGPVFKSAKSDGARLIVTFDTAGSALSTGDAPLHGFAIAGKDGVYQTADGIIDGDSVILTSPLVPEPVTVRYAWAGTPCSTLENLAGLPAAPFRTDSLPVSKGHGEPQRQLEGYLFKGANYQITISGEGRVTSLIARNQQLLSNAADSWGGTSIENRNLSQLKLIGPDTLQCSNNETQFKIDFSDSSLRWTITNTHPKQDLKFHIALSPGVEVSADESKTGESKTGELKTVSLKKMVARVTITDIDRVTAYHDIAADDGRVLEVDVPPGGSKTIELNVK